jgi:hypothetical protein
MPGTHSIQYLRNNEIDKALWNQCIEKAGNGSIYAMSFYLDRMTDNWDALVLNNYEAVMPLPWRKKYGIFYLYQPFLFAQGGLFGKTINGELLSEFLNSIPEKFRYWDMVLNQQNLFPVEGFSLYQRTNYILELHKPYEVIYQDYRENTKRNIKKSVRFGNSVQKNVDVDTVIELAKVQTANSTETDYTHFKKIYEFLKEKGAAKTYAVCSKQNQVIASAVFFFWQKRAYYILVGNHPNGKTLGASHALIDAFIKDHAEQEIILDFEGSDAGSLAFFYSSFGATEEKYAAIKLNRLPWYLKLIKK